MKDVETIDADIGRSAGDAGPARRALTLDVALYQGLLDDPDIEEADKMAFLEALWSIMVAFVDLGFDVGPAAKSCGQVGQGDDPRPLPGPDAISLADRFGIENDHGAQEPESLGRADGRQS